MNAFSIPRYRRKVGQEAKESEVRSAPRSRDIKTGERNTEREREKGLGVRGGSTEQSASTLAVKCFGSVRERIKSRRAPRTEIKRVPPSRGATERTSPVGNGVAARARLDKAHANSALRSQS